MKHAYLIVAHTDFKVLEKLIELLDFSGNDIYVHIDKKVSYTIKYRPVKSMLYVVSDEHRIDVRWADCVQLFGQKWSCINWHMTMALMIIIT